MIYSVVRLLALSDSKQPDSFLKPPAMKNILHLQAHWNRIETTIRKKGAIFEIHVRERHV